MLTTTSLSPAARVLVAVGRRAPAGDLLVAQRMRALLMAHLAHLFVTCRGKRSEYGKHDGQNGRNEQDDTFENKQSKEEQRKKLGEAEEEATEKLDYDKSNNNRNFSPDYSPVLLLLSPTTPTAGARITKPNVDLRHGVSDGNASFKSMEYTYLANFTGLPALSVPVGYVEPDDDDDGQSHGQDQGQGKSEGSKDNTGKIPIGMQAMGEWGAEEDLIEWGYDMEEYLHLHSASASASASASELGANAIGEKGSGSTINSENGSVAGSGRILPGVWVDALGLARDRGGKEEKWNGNGYGDKDWVKNRDEK